MCLSRFLRINSGLRRMNSRFGPPPEFVRNGLIYLAVFAAGWGLSRANRKSSRFYGKNRELLSALAPQVLVFQGAPPGGADGVLALLESREIALDASGVPILP